MKILLSILEALISLLSRKRNKVLAPSSDYKKLGVDKDGEEWGTTAEMSEEDLEYARQQFEFDQQEQEEQKNIICNGHEVGIDWENTVVWTEPGALKCKSPQYKSSKADRKSVLNKIVVHWEGSFSSKQ